MEKNIRLEADKFLIREEVTSLPINFDKLSEIAKRKKWILATYKESEELIKRLDLVEFSQRHDALTTIAEGTNCILYAEYATYENKIFSILHEFGHIELYHTYEGAVLGNSSIEKIEQNQEREANLFAYEVLSPVCVLKRCKIKSFDELEALKLVSSVGNLDIYKKIKDTEAYESNIEEQLCENFKGFISTVKKIKRRKVYKRFAFVLLFILIFTMGYFASTIEINNILPDGNTYTGPSDITDDTGTTEYQGIVYITRTGTKYHKPTCSYVRNRDDLREMTIEEALEEGLQPCKVCEPDS